MENNRIILFENDNNNPSITLSIFIEDRYVSVLMDLDPREDEYETFVELTLRESEIKSQKELIETFKRRIFGVYANGNLMPPTMSEEMYVEYLSDYADEIFKSCSLLLRLEEASRNIDMLP